MDAIVQNMFEINYSQLIQYEILEKLVTCMSRKGPKVGQGMLDFVEDNCKILCFVNFFKFILVFFNNFFKIFFYICAVVVNKSYIIIGKGA